MLVVLNLIIILLVLGMAALWATYGFFSAFLQLIVIIVSGVIALALWEPLTFWLLGRMPAYAHGVGLLAPFALSIIILRVPLDKYCKMNLHLPHLADQIGGAACGIVSGILAFGMLLNGANFLPIEKDALGWQPYNITGNDLVPNPEGQLWGATRINEWSGSFFEFLSGGAMSPTGGTSLAQARPDLATRALQSRAIIDANQSRAAAPESVKITGVYAVPATVESITALIQRSVIFSFLAQGYTLPADINYGEDGMGLVNAIRKELANRYEDPDKYGRPSELLNVPLIIEANSKLDLGVKGPTSQAGFERFLNEATTLLTNKLLKTDAGEPNAFTQQLGEGKILFFVDTLWNNTTPGAYDGDSKLRVAISQIRLQIKAGEETQLIAPVGYSIQYSKNTGGRTFTELLTSQRYSANAQFPDFSMGWAFILPANVEPIRFFARELRFDLTQLPIPEGQQSPVNNNLGAVAQVMGPPRVPTPQEGEDSGIDGQRVAEGAVAIGSIGAYAEVSERIPRSFGGATSTSIEPDKSEDRWTLREGKDDNVKPGRGGQKSTISEIWVPKDSRLVRIQLDPQRAQSLYGAAIGLAKNLNPMRVKDANGNAHDAIGYLLDRKDHMEIDIRGDGAATGGLSASELPTFADGETMYLYFQVPAGTPIVSFLQAGTEEMFEKPLVVEAKK